MWVNNTGKVVMSSLCKVKIQLEQKNGEIEREGQREETGGERQDDGEQREGGTEYSGLACGNSDVVFMDVYLSASPRGSSHFPLGNSWSAGKMFLTGSRKSG